MQLPNKQLLPLFLLIFIDTVGYFVVIPVVIRIFLHGDGHLIPTHTSIAMRDMLYSLALMLSPLAFIFCSPIIGHLSDRYGRKKALIGALIAACIGFLLPVIGIIKHMLSLIFIGRFIAGASSSSQPVAQAGVTDITTGSVRAFYLSLIGFAMTLGMVIGPLSGSYLSDTHLVHWFNITTPYIFAVVLSVLNVFMFLLCYNNTNQQTDHNNPQPLHTLVRLLAHYKIWGFMLSFFFLEIGWSQYYQAAFLTLSQHFHYTTNQVSLFTTYTGFWMCIGLTVIYRYLIRHYAIKHIAQVSLLILALSFSVCIIPNSTVQWLMMIPATICIGTAYPSLLAMMSQRSDKTHQGYVLGCTSTALGIAWMLTGLIAGPIIAIWFNLPNLIAAIAMIVAYLSFTLSNAQLHMGTVND